MPLTKPPKFKVGDVIASKVTKEKGIIVDFEKKAEELELEDLNVLEANEILKKISNGKKCAVTDFEELSLEVVLTSILELCEGTKNKELCFECEYFFKCPESDFALTCKTNGKLVKKFCIQCKYKFKCFSSKESDC